ncbi:hypothetical protein D3C87_1411910 [compost metagenome]
MHGAANGLAFPERRARANHGIQQRHIAVIAQDLDGLTGDRDASLDHIGHDADLQGLILDLGMLRERLRRHGRPQIGRGRDDRDNREVGNQERARRRGRMHGGRAVDKDVVVVVDEFADFAVHRATGRRQADHGSGKRALIARLCGPTGGGALFVHIDKHGTGAAQAQRASQVHAHRGLATAAFLVEHGNDFCCHTGLTFSAESAHDEFSTGGTVAKSAVRYNPFFIIQILCVVTSHQPVTVKGKHGLP